MPEKPQANPIEQQPDPAEAGQVVWPTVQPPLADAGTVEVAEHFSGAHLVLHGVRRRELQRHLSRSPSSITRCLGL